MKYFVTIHKKLLIIQLLIIILISIFYLSSSKQYISSITISPIYASTLISSSNGAPLISIYSPSFASNFYLKELSNADTRDLIFKEFLKNNSLSCDQSEYLEPSIQVYQKLDNSFPVSDSFMNIQVKSACKELTKNYVTFFANAAHSFAIEKIQSAENEFLDQQIDTLSHEINSNLHDLEIYVSTRKENLRKLIPLLAKESSNSVDFVSQTQEFPLQKNLNLNDTKVVNLAINIPTSLRAAQAELDFLSSLDDLSESSIGLISMNNQIQNYKNKHNFSDDKLVKISRAGRVIVSKRNLYLAVFFILVSLGLGYVQIAFRQYKNHQKMQ
jgi:hypothetical protein